MTQLQYYTALVHDITLFAAFALGSVGIISFAVLTYYLYPWLKK
jgi:hypothetical protein